MYRYICFAVFIVVCVSVRAQEFEPMSAEDCLDRFQTMYTKVNQNYAVIGSMTATSIEMPALSKTQEWFAVENPSSSTGRKFYSESRSLYPHAPESNVWEKRFISGNTLRYSLGEYLEPLREVSKKDDEDDKKYLGRASIGCPNLFSLAIVVPSEQEMITNGEGLLSLIGNMKYFTERKVGNDIVGGFYGSRFVSEITFSRKSGYLPTNVKTYFYTPPASKKGPPQAGEFKVLWHESDTTWHRVSDEIWVPVRVTSTKHRNSPTSRSHSKEIEATAVWNTSVDKKLLSDESVKVLPLDGPIALVRAHLFEKDNGEKRTRKR